MIQYLAESRWRWMLASSGVPGAIILPMRFGTPESPRWLISKGRIDEAREAVRRVFGLGADTQSRAAERGAAQVLAAQQEHKARALALAREFIRAFEAAFGS
jgi:hypothetical protein